MAKQTAASEAKDRPYKTTGVHLPADLWELLNRVAFERARTRGGRASVSALLISISSSMMKLIAQSMVTQEKSSSSSRPPELD
jgi:hypothetical protein